MESIMSILDLYLSKLLRKESKLSDNNDLDHKDNKISISEEVLKDGIESIVERLTANVLPDVRFVPGCVVKCDLWALDHTGIYVGEGKFVHRTGDASGYIEQCDYDTFLNRLNGNNNAISIYVACKADGPIAEDAIAHRALNSIGKSNFDGYNLLFRNCHHFTHYCITGKNIETPQNCTFQSIDTLLRQKYNMDMWRIGKI